MDLANVEEFICYGRTLDMHCRSIYAWDEKSQLHLLSALDFWQTDNYLDYQVKEFTSMFPTYGWTKTVADIQEIAASGEGQDRFLLIGRLSDIEAGEQSVFYSEALQCYIAGQSWQAVLSNASGEVEVLVLPTLLNNEELAEELLHMVSYREQDGVGQYLVEMSTMPAARYLL